MDKEKVYSMSVAKVYPLLVAKAERKGRSQDEVDALINWLCGYGKEELRAIIEKGSSYRDFFEHAPAFNPSAIKITGSICGIRVEEIEDPLMWKIRCLDKLVDELAKGKPLEKIMRK